MLALFLLCVAKAHGAQTPDDLAMLREKNIAALVLAAGLLAAAFCAAAPSLAKEDAVPGSKPQQVLPLPALVQDGETLSLRCGQVYSGTLDLRGRRNVTVRTEESSEPVCRRASVTPAVPVRGWTREGKLWWAALDFAPLMVQIGDTFMTLAHHPNTPGEWLTGEGRGPDRLKVKLPHDLTGATLVWRPEDWLILSQRVVSDEIGLLRIAPSADADVGFRERTPYYLEGQRWMLDSPGEWVYEQGRLVVWPADGRSPEGRTWAAPQATAIDARGAHDIRIENVNVFLAARGIDVAESRNVSVADVNITHSFDEAIRIGGEDMRISRVRVSGTRQHGLRAEDDARRVQITDSVINGAGMLGMPLRSKGAIVFEQAIGQQIVRNQISDAAYIGIRVFRDAVVTDNVITRACQRMTDCGGIYTFSRDRQPLQTRIERNQISGLGQRGGAADRLSHAIYLDDFANGVIVRDNQLLNNPGGMQLHDAFDNVISGNLFSHSQNEHILFNETTSFSAVSGNQVKSNRFLATTEAPEVPVYRLWSHQGSAHLSRFALFENNRYQGKFSRFAQLEGIGWVGADVWRERMGDEAAGSATASATAAATRSATTAETTSERTSATAAPPKLARKPKQKERVRHQIAPE